MLRVGVLASGRGTDLQSIIDASEAKKTDAKVVVVISDHQDAYALERARRHGIDAIHVETRGKKRENYEAEIDAILVDRDVGLVVGAGWMRILKPFFIDRWRGKLINIHPSLLPSFPGTHAQADAIGWGVMIAGCTTHFITREVDRGPIILQAALPVKVTDTKESLAQRILEVEHQILPRTVELLAQGRVRLVDEKVEVLSGDSWKDLYPTIPGVLYSEGY